MKYKIKFNSFYSSSNYTKNLTNLFSDYDLFREKFYSNKCLEELEKDYSEADLWLTHSATGALEMIALALDIKDGDEIILPSYTFVSSANAFALRGAKLIFVDIELDTFGIDPELVKSEITSKTKAIVAMHYAGKACKINELRSIAQRNGIYLIEDAAMSMGVKHQDKALGTFGDFAVISFDITKHIAAVQGGLLICNSKKYKEKLDAIYHLGTNRSAFEKQEVPYYEWVNLGSKYQLTETNSAILYEQLLTQDNIYQKRAYLSSIYYNELKNLAILKNINEGMLADNFHEFFILCKNNEERKQLQGFMNKHGIETLFHYVPLHSSFLGSQIGLCKQDKNTNHVSDCLLRLPLHSNLTENDVFFVCQKIKDFYRNE